MKIYDQLFAFLGGIVVGGGLTYYCLDDFFDKKYKEKLDLAIDNVKKYEIEKKITAKKADYKAESFESNTGRESGLLNNDAKIVIKDSFKTEGGEFIDYTKFYTAKNDSKEVSDVEVAVDTVETGAEKLIHDYSEESRRTSMSPKIASEREFEMLPREFERIKLLYFVYSDSLVSISDPDNWKVIDQEDHLGECLTQYGFDHNDEETLYVVNYQRNEAYTVLKKWDTYGRH